MLWFFHLFWTDSSANYIFLHLDVKIQIINTNTIITLLKYVSNLFCFDCECTQIKADLYPVIINNS